MGECGAHFFLAFVLARLSRAGRDSSLARAANLERKRGTHRERRGGGSMALLSHSHLLSLRPFLLLCSRAQMGLLSLVDPLTTFSLSWGPKTGALLLQIHNATFDTYYKASMDIPSSLLQEEDTPLCPQGI